MNVHRIVSTADSEFKALLRIYTDSLPASERKSLSALNSMIARPEYLFLAAVDAGAVVGFSIAIALLGSDAALLEYMAVDADRRSLGIGKALFFATAARPELHSRLLLIEVESGSARTKRFYRRLGTRQVEGLTYLMPQVSSAQPPLMDMLVYGDEPPDAIDKAQLRNWLAACYDQVYDVPENDPCIRTMLNGLPETIRLI